MTKLALLDRDGTIVVEKNYLFSPHQVELLPGAAEGIKLLRVLGLATVVVTNQSGIGRGYFGLEHLDLIHQRLCKQLARRGTGLDAIYVCPHLPDSGCNCRKPAAGLAWKAATEFQADLSRSFMVGDKKCDIDFGKNIGAITILVRTGYGESLAAEGKSQPDFIVKDLLEAAKVIQRCL